MYKALRATSLTLVEALQKSFQTDVELRSMFSPPGNMVVSLNSPEEMTSELAIDGLSVWLYRVVRDSERLNAPPERISSTQTRRVPLPVCLHYLMTPIVNATTSTSPETEQIILGKVLQVLHDHPILRGVDFDYPVNDFRGSEVELHVHLEPLSLEELSRVYDALNRSFQLSISYDVSVVYIESTLDPEVAGPVRVALPEYGVITSP